MPSFISTSFTEKIFALGALVALTSCAPADKTPVFDFEAATQADRQAWLQPKAEQTSKGYVDGLNRNGLSLYTEVPVKVDAGRRQIVVTARLNSTMAKVNITPDQKKQLERVTCKDYLKSQYYPAKITIVNRILENNKREAFRITQSPKFCENMAKSTG